MEKIMQGDAYGIPFVIETDNGRMTPDMLSDLEITIGEMRKTLTEAGIRCDAAGGRFLFLLTQEESLALPAIPQKVQLRCKFPNGEVVGQDLGVIDVTASLSKVVL